MARTLVGILQILLKQDVTQRAPEINRALDSIENHARRLGNSPWGAGFQRQLDRLKVSPAEAAAIKASYERLARDINGRISRADLSAWRHGTITHLTAVRAGLRETATQAKQMHAAIASGKAAAGNWLKPGLVALGAYTGWYAAGLALREGFNAGGERQREFFRQDMAGVPQGEQVRIAQQAQLLTLKYPSVGMTQIMEMARTARNTMGDTEAGLAILEDMVRGLVTLQSSQGVGASNEAMMRLLRGLDNLGLNAGGDVGLESMRMVIAGAIRAAQIEGGEIDVGQYFDFARRAKVAGPALSDEFLATTVGALMQDMTASGAGNAIAMLFKSFVLGDNSINGKVYKQRQTELGLRDESGLVDPRLMGENPYQWTKKYLVPALQEAGVDLTNDTDVAAAVGKLSGNTNATGLLTRMITQSQQIERLIGLYSQAMGPNAADSASTRDPFVSWKGFTSAFENLSGALGEHAFPVIIPALNGVTSGINNLAQAARNAEGWQVGIAGAAAALGVFGALKLGTGLFGGLIALGTAGPSLQTAAIMLQGAATSLGGGAVAGGTAAAGGAAAGGLGAWLTKWGLKGVKAGGLLGALAVALDSSPVNEGEDAALYADPAYRQMIEDAQFQGELAKTRPRGPFGRGGRRPDPAFQPLAPIWPTMNADITSPAKHPFGYSPADQKASLEQIGTAADNARASLQGINTTITPTVDLTSIASLIELLKQAIALQRQLGAVPNVSGMTGGAKTQVRAAFNDFGVTP